ncbi:hypothetical protein ACFFWC_22615 [Plantactinospora siamensis]|uniref:Uncharacterized protein n=1 Tax=Plantactinospora siamensis TaxID=555372 RepID=A0ABV6NYJ3_9ACTN
MFGSAYRRVPVLVGLLALPLIACSAPAARPVTVSATQPGSPPPAATAAPSSAAAASGSAGLGRRPAAKTSTATKAAAAAGGDCGVFPADNVWHADVSKLPVHARSAGFVSSVGAGGAVHADFGSGEWDGAPIGIPVTVVPPGQPKVPVSFEYADESDPGPYPIPAGAAVEGGAGSDGDRHVIVWDQAACRSYELFAAQRSGAGWKAGSGAVFDLRSNALRRAGWTSADASGLSILAGLVRYDEVATGRIDHAIRFTVPRSRTGYTWPATHSASSATDANLPQMGQRFRLKASVSTAGLPRQARIIAEAMKRYGMIVADNGSGWYISGAPDPHWDNDDLHALGGLRGSDFEAVDASGLRVSATSGQVGN